MCKVEKLIELGFESRWKSYFMFRFVYSIKNICCSFLVSFGILLFIELKIE